MKRILLFLLAALLLLSLCACAFLNDPGDALRDKLLQGVASGLEPTPTPAPTVPIIPEGPGETPPAQAGLASSPWAQRLAGYWVDTGESADPGAPFLLYFTGDGRVYTSPEDYGRLCAAETGQPVWNEAAGDYEYISAEDVTHDAWTLVEGVPHYLKNAEAGVSRPWLIEFGEDDAMQIAGQGLEGRRLERSAAPRATSFLLGTDYAYLAENAKLAYLIFGEELSQEEGYATVWLSAATWVYPEDAALIARYGLESFFEDGEEYSLYHDDSAWQPLFVMTNGETAFRIYDYDEEGFLWPRNVDFETFLNHAESYGGGEGLLVLYSDEETESLVFAIAEQYVP